MSKTPEISDTGLLPPLHVLRHDYEAKAEELGIDLDATVIDSLDMLKPGDRKKLMRALDNGDHPDPKKRWGKISTERKGRYIEALDIALGLALKIRDSRQIRGCIDTLATIEAQNQAEEMAAEKNARLDSDKSTENQTIRVVHVDRIHKETT